MQAIQTSMYFTKDTLKPFKGKAKNRKGLMITGLCEGQSVFPDSENIHLGLHPKERDRVLKLVRELGGFPVEMTILIQALERHPEK